METTFSKDTVLNYWKWCLKGSSLITKSFSVQIGKSQGMEDLHHYMIFLDFEHYMYGVKYLNM